MKTRVAFIHTTSLVIKPVQKAVEELSDRFKFFHILDEALLLKMMDDGNTPELTVPWLTGLVEKAVKGGASMVIVTCSSLSPAVNAVAGKFPVPVIRIDESMYLKVLSRNESPAVLMTNPTNKIPAELISEEIRKKLDKNGDIPMVICPGAFDFLVSGRQDLHDNAVLKTVNELEKEHDAVILSQISIEPVRALLPPGLREKVYSSLDFVADTIRMVLS
ncbi:MAG: hypothetical protein GY786_25390 [Proteobacteria bacterium]|nr:hypothetical protein [Pseudomonadota bacterium]